MESPSTEHYNYLREREKKSLSHPNSEQYGLQIVWREKFDFYPDHLRANSQYKFNGSMAMKDSGGL